MSPARASLVFHTVRHLKPVQIYGRLWFKLPRPTPRSRPTPCRREQVAPFRRPASRKPSLVGPTCFHLLNESRDVDDHGWDDPTLSKLWRYNLHYFDDLNAQNTEQRRDWHRDLIRRWIAENPPAKGTGWEPYPTALRIVNWIKWALAGNTLPAEAAGSLAMQARWLTKRMEHHLQGNHLFSNAKALLFAGCFFAGRDAETWLATGLALLRRELCVQILADGGHFELSPMYHALILEDALDCLNIAQAFALAPDFAGELARIIPSMRSWLAALSHPDGEIAFFNDAAFGVAPSPASLDAYAARLGFEAPAFPHATTHLADSGYCRLARGPFTAILDLAPVGPDHLPGHAHADTLSFELSLGLQRVIVNSGTAEYGLGPERQRQRGTAAHSTLCVEGLDSSEVWAGFRVARRAKVLDAFVREEQGTVIVRASHDGYSRLPGRPVHTRHWQLDDKCLTVSDKLSGPLRKAEARFHLHPALDACLRGGELSVFLHGDLLLNATVTIGAPRLEQSTWHPEFGLSQPNLCLAVAADNNRATVRFHL